MMKVSPESVRPHLSHVCCSGVFNFTLSQHLHTWDLSLHFHLFFLKSGTIKIATRGSCKCSWWPSNVVEGAPVSLEEASASPSHSEDTERLKACEKPNKVAAHILKLLNEKKSSSRGPESAWETSVLCAHTRSLLVCTNEQHHLVSTTYSSFSQYFACRLNAPRYFFEPFMRFAPTQRVYTLVQQQHLTFCHPVRKVVSTKLLALGADEDLLHSTFFASQR